jgi:hypothetical protein
LPAKDRYHDTVKRALIKDGWTITAEQVTLIGVTRQVIIDIEASKGELGEIILVEVKGFERSPVEQLALAIGKLQIYRFMLDELGREIPLGLQFPTMLIRVFCKNQWVWSCGNKMKLTCSCFQQNGRRLPNGYPTRNPN